MGYSYKDVKKCPYYERRRDILPKYEAKVITRGNCMICGKELTEGLFFCEECDAKASEFLAEARACAESEVSE